MATLPIRGAAVRALGLPLPPGRMPPLQRGRPLKRWRYVGVYGPELMLCVGDARVAGCRSAGGRWRCRTGRCARARRRAPRARRARVRRDVRSSSSCRGGAGRRGRLAARPLVHLDAQAGAASGARTVRRRRARVEVDGDAASSTSPPATTRATRLALVGRASAVAATAARVAWNLVDGVHDAPAPASARSGSTASRTRWRPARSPTTSPGWAGCASRQWGAREDHTNRLVLRSDYLQPFGSFTGSFPVASSSSRATG